MAEQDKLLIRLHVYDTDLSVRIPREDEEYYRKSAKLIDDIVNSYTKIFKGRKSDKEILYMALKMCIRDRLTPEERICF